MIANDYSVVVANAPDLDLAPYRGLLEAADLIIAADGGALALLRIGILPARVLGDLDSLDEASIAALSAQGVAFRRFARAKDETDLELALLEVAGLNYRRIDVLGALGGRWDHTLANVAMLAHPALEGSQVRLLDAQQELFLIRDRALIQGKRGDTVSLLPLTAAVSGITTHGLQYALSDATLYFQQARGVSNVLLEPPGEVQIREGLLLVVHHDDGGRYQWNPSGNTV